MRKGDKARRGSQTVAFSMAGVAGDVPGVDLRTEIQRELAMGDSISGSGIQCLLI